MDTQHWHTTQAVGEWVDPRNRQRWRHHRSGRFSRWEQHFVGFAGDQWKAQTLTAVWFGKLQAFVHSCWQQVRLRAPEDAARIRAGAPAPGGPRSGAEEHPGRPVRDVLRQPFPFENGGDSAQHVTRLDICSDSELVVQWCNGLAIVKQRDLRPLVRSLVLALDGLAQADVRERTTGADYVRHVFRELNGAADYLAGAHLDETVVYAPPPWPRFLRLHTDGSLKSGEAGLGWILLGTDTAEDDSADGWRTLAATSYRLPQRTTSTEAELCAVDSALRFLQRALTMGARVSRGPWPEWRIPLLVAAARPRVWRVRRLCAPRAHD